MITETVTRKKRLRTILAWVLSDLQMRRHVLVETMLKFKLARAQVTTVRKDVVVPAEVPSKGRPVRIFGRTNVTLVFPATRQI